MLYDIIIVGGGLGGLISAIELSKRKYQVLLIEKNPYPTHKVCGEFLSNEVIDYLQSLGACLPLLNLPKITDLYFSDCQGKNLAAELTLGGIGISRYLLDSQLFGIAQDSGVHFAMGGTVEDIQKINNVFFVDTNLNQTFEAKVVIGAYGRRAKLDKNIKRIFKKESRVYVGVKYHIRAEIPDNLFSIHNFKGGYAGVSAVEDGMKCFCYVAERKLVREQGSIQDFEQNVIAKNPILHEILHNAEFISSKPLVTNEIAFNQKTPVFGNILMVGDTAGFVTPIAGNGMAMAIKSAVMLSKYIDLFLQNKMSREQMELEYTLMWNSNFQNRLKMGRFLQNIFGKEFNSKLTVLILKNFPLLIPKIIKGMHGKRLKIKEYS